MNRIEQIIHNLTTTKQNEQVVEPTSSKGIPIKYYSEEEIDTLKHKKRDTAKRHYGNN